jgi:hypothetical protein
MPRQHQFHDCQIAAHCDWWVFCCSSSYRTERSRNSSGYRFGLLLPPSSQEMGPPKIPGRFRACQVLVERRQARHRSVVGVVAV